MGEIQEKNKFKALQNVSINLAVANKDSTNFNNLFTALVERIEYLIQHDFNALINILYRVDVPEKKLNDTLKANQSQPASEIIAKLLIERELQKMVFRAKYSK